MGRNNKKGRNGRTDDRRADNRAPRPGPWRSLKEGTRRSIIGILLLVLSVFLILAGFGTGGTIGTSIYDATHFVFGVGYWVLPLLALLLAVNYFRAEERSLLGPALFAGPFFIFSALALLSFNAIDGGAENAYGGWIGYWVMKPTTTWIGFATAVIFYLAMFLISVLVLFDLPLHLGIFNKLLSFLPKRKEEEKKGSETNVEVAAAAAETTPVAAAIPPAPLEEEKPEEPASAAKPELRKEEPKRAPETAPPPVQEKDIPKAEQVQFRFNSLLHGAFTPPPLSLLSQDKGKVLHSDTNATKNLIKQTLQNYGIEVEMGNVTVGPTVSRYTLRPAMNVKLSRIVALQRELELALAAFPIRIEAPIPGQSLVGIEVPNTQKETVGLHDLLASPSWLENPEPLYVPLGKGISGTPLYMDIARMPHLLIAGATGSGKSVTIHTIITSLLYRRTPEHLRFIMIDPKRVELTAYDGIPHLLTPVITEGKKAILTLRWAANEMDRRYDVLREKKCRDISSYHQNVLSPAIEKYEKEKAAGRTDPENPPDLPEMMPFIVIVIDELADIMQVYQRELESAIVRLAQMSRAVGIHLILSTQRPSVNVITGLIKANVPARIALHVNSGVDSRTILDQVGAENLVGKGDMLFLSAEIPKPVRLQSAFISENEVRSIVKYLKEHSDSTLGNELFVPSAEGTLPASSPLGTIPESSLTEASDDEDEMYEEAKKLVIESGKASTSLLQRRLSIGYGRAARIIDMLEQNGIVGPAVGAKPREVLIRSSNSEEGFGQEEHTD